MPAVSETKYITNAGWKDVPHLSDDEQRHLRDTTPPHMLPATEHGVPVSSVGRIYPWDFDRIAIDPFRLPVSWPRAYGFDPSVNNTAAAWAALDEATNTVYLYGEYHGTHQIPRIHAQDILLRGDWVPGLCDPSAEGKTLDGRKVIDVYKGCGLKHLRYADNAVTAGLTAVIDLVTTGRLRAFSTLQRLRFEWNNYRRDKRGKIIKENDHVLDCLRYLCLGGMQFARVDPAYVDARSIGGTAGVGDSLAGF